MINAPAFTVEQAEDLAARTLAATADVPATPSVVADRERVASDLAGLQQHLRCDYDAYNGEDCPDAARYAAGLRRTAALYGITP